MAFDVFLSIKDIPGECTDDKHKGWIEVLSYSTGLAQPSGGSVSATGGHSGGRADLHDLTCVIALGKQSPKLALACAKGTHIPEVKLELCHNTDEKNKYMEYKLTDAIIRSVRPGGSAKGGEDRPLEEVSFGYAKIDWTYTEFDNKGKKKGDIAANWDLGANKGA
jgi:type VI secretion system secreted protein Hcp